MIISVEGLDGVGKSSLVTKLSQTMQIPVIEKPIKFLLELTPRQSENIKEKIYGKYSADIQAMYYLLGYLSALEDGEKKDYIFDRGFLSTYYFSCCEENAKLFDFFANEYGFPEVTILLYATKDTRVKRIQSRNKKDKDLNKSRIYMDDYEKFFDAIQRYNIPHIAINTEHITQEETCDLVLNILNLWRQGEEYKDFVLNTYRIDKLSQNGKISYLEQKEILKNAFRNPEKAVERVKK